MKGRIMAIVIIYIFIAITTVGGSTPNSSDGFDVGISELKDYTWFNGDQEKHVFAALDEIAIFPKNVSETNNVSELIRSFDPNAILIKSSEFITIVRLPNNLDIMATEYRVAKFQNITGNGANLVFYQGKKKDQSPMGLTGEIIVHFREDWDENYIASWAKDKGLETVENFSSSSPNTYLFRAGSGIISLELANQIYLSGEVIYAYPNWWKAMSTKAIPNDPLYLNQWHLNNTGQGGGTHNEDVNITSVWDRYGGSNNEVIAIVDDGLEIAHEDMAPNILPGYSWDYVGNDPDPTAGDHGTSVAGVAAARGWNALGVTGAAPYTKLVGYRLLDSWAFIEANAHRALSNNSQIVDIYSNSWGPTDNRHLDDPTPLTIAALVNGTINGRGGKGNIYVLAGGNGNSANEINADNSNYDGYANSRYIMAIAASDNAGRQSWYSENGANILINTPSNGGSLGITTTDRTGSLGYDPGSNYTDSFGGTSSATPLASGIISLMLQANPNLTWRDVRLILAKTAEKNDPTDSDWTRNGAGYNINHKYGFGRIDAYAAVNAATNWNSVGPEVTEAAYRSPNLPIPDNNSVGVSDTITITQNISIEFVEINFTAGDHTNWGNLEIELTSPLGTRSILAKKHSVGTTQGYNNWIFGSVRHMGEFSNGTWRLTVKDLLSGDTGTFQRWGLRIYGTKTNAGGPDNFGYTFKDSNTPDGPTYDWIEINTTGTQILPSNDDGYLDNLPVGFFFNFYGTDYSQLSITNNGIILASGGSSQYTNNPVGNSILNNFIAPFWDDIVTWGLTTVAATGISSTSPPIKTKTEGQTYMPLASTLATTGPAAIYYQTLGTAPNRMFVVEWYNNQHYYNSQKGVTFEAILYEGSNNIKFQYKDVEFGTVSNPFSGDYPPFDNGGSATVGIEAPSGVGLQYSYNQQVLSPGLAILYKFPQYAGTNLYLSKLAPAGKDRGSIMKYDLFYHNFGDTAAQNVVLYDTLPLQVDFVSASDGGIYNAATRNVTWNLGSLMPSNHGYRNITVRINQSAAIGTVIQNHASITNSNLEVRIDDNEAIARTTVTGSNLPSNVGVEPNNGGTGTPSVVWHTPITFSYYSPCATGIGINIHYTDGGPDITGTMTESSPDTWTYTTTFTRTGSTTVNYTISGCIIPIVSFNIYIDPAGYIYDIDTGSRISGATVWLQRPDGIGGWENVPTGQNPPISQPDTNPLITGSDGQYQWDVLEGSYRVHVEAAGYNPTDSIAVSIPPPVTDLHVGLTRILDEIVIGVTPTGTNVSVISQITMTFNRSMNQSSVQSAFSTFPNTTGSFTWSGNTMTYTPDPNLAYNQIYNVTLGTEAEDLAGNNLLSPYGWQFRTIIPIYIDRCTTISTPGEYALNQSIINSNTANCITITSSDVIFDGAGYTIDGNGLTNYGLYANNVNHITVRNLVVQDWNTRAVNIVNSNNNYFSNITVKSGNYDGFYLQNSNSNILRDIKVFNTVNVGFTFDNSQGNDLKDSIFQNNLWEDFDIYPTGGVSACNNEAGNVSLTKYPLYYSNRSIDLKDIYAGAIYLCNADNSTVTNATVAANGQSSISNYYVENVTYTNITTSGLKEAIFFKNSQNNNITNILMKDGWSGITYSTNTNNTNYKNATIYNMTDRAVRIYGGASRNTISDSKIYNSSVGIYLNTAGKYGPNKIYNTYLNNMQNIEWGIPDFFGDGTVYPNSWNIAKQSGTNIVGGPNLGGNFWGNPAGTGPSQTCTDADGDGICDLAYTLKSNNIDYLPLAPPTIPSITVISPNSGEDWTQGSTRVIRWNYQVSPGPNVMIELLKNGVSSVLISSTSIGSSGSGSYDWQIDPAQTPDSDYKIRITSTADPAYTDTSDNNFAISEPSFNLIKNGGFESGKNNWTFYSNVAGSFNIVSPGYEGNNAAMIKLDSIGANMQFYQYLIPMEPNTRYRLSFAAYSTYGDDVVVKLIKHAGSTPYAPDFPADLGTNWQTFSTEFISSGSAMNDARLMFWFVNVGAKAGEAYYIDDVRLEKVSSPITQCTTISSPGKYVLTQNIINSNVESCINIISSDVIFDGAGYTIDGNGLTNYGLSVKNVNQVTVKNLVIQDWNLRAVNILNSNNDYFKNITVKSGNYDGFYLQNSNNNILRNIKVLNTVNVGFTFDNSQGNDVKDSIFQNNSWEDFDIYPSGGVSACNNDVANVSLTKYSLYYYNKSVNIKDIYAGAIYLCNADNSTITNVTVAANGQSSISNYYVENVTYNNITTSGLKEAIFFKNSANNNITNILMKDGWSGISYSTDTTNTNYKNATIYNMTGRAIRIYAGASRNTISDSKIYNSSVGIYLNTAGKYGPNKIYNSYFNNTQNIEWGIADFFGDGSVYPNYWNTTKQSGTNIMGGPNLGGNFWAYPNSTGLSQTCTDADSDGICDLTYTLKSNNIDYLPLAYNPSSGPVHNINKGTNYATIQAAINDASPGNEIHVDSGTYYENVNVNKQLILRGIGMPVVDAGGSGSAIALAADGITLEGFTATNASTGISGYFSGSNIKDNQIISNYGSGIGVLGGYNTISGNHIISNYGDGIQISGTENTIKDNEIKSNANGIGLDLLNNSVIGNNITYNGDGIYLVSDSKKMKISGNNIDFNSNGIHFPGDNHESLVENNNIRWNTGTGISIDGYESGHWNTIYNNYFNNNINTFVYGNNYGFVNYWNITKTPGINIIGGPNLGGNFWAHPNGTGFSQTCTDADGDGICNSAYVLDSNNIDYLPIAYNAAVRPVHNINKGTNYTTIQAAIDDANPGNEIRVDSGNYQENVKIDRSVTLMGAGADATIVQAANASDHVFNVKVNSVNITGFKITGANVDNNAGIYLYSSSYNNITGNNVSNNSIGIYLSSSGNNIFNYNTVSSNGIGIRLENLALNNNFNNNIVISNGWTGISLTAGGPNNFNNNTVSSNGGAGITLWQAGGKFNNNTINSNGGAGIEIADSGGCDCNDNTISSNGGNGISDYSYGNGNYNNNIVESNGGVGINIPMAGNTKLTNNTLSLNTIAGIYFNGGSNIVYNNIFNNDINLQFREGYIANYWNTTKTLGTNIVSGPNLGGNFWAHPNGTGFSQTCTDADGDGICDSAYVLDSNNTDYLPLANPIAPDFTISASPSSRSIVQGSSTTYNVSLTSLNGFNSAVSFSATGLPAGVTASFSPGSVTPTGTSVLNIQTSGSTPTGSHSLTINGTGSGKTHPVTVTLVVSSEPDFTISASPSSQSVVQGSSTTYSISLTSLNGFNSAVSLNASGLPANVTASFSPGSVTPTGTSTLDIQTSGLTPAGSFNINITGTGGGKTHNITAELIVSSQFGTIKVTTNNPGATFTVTGPATYPGSGTSWSQSNAPVGTYSITFGPINGFNTPSDTPKTLSSGGTITFSGNYTLKTGSNWSMDISANSTDTFGNLLESILNFGVNTAATDGYDGPPFDIDCPPVSPIGFDFCFIEPGVSTERLINDTKAPGISKNWTLLAQAPKSRKINITWFSENIPSDLVIQIQELDPNTGLPIGSPIDMKSVNLISFTAGPFSNMQKGYRITASSEISHTISLSRGWNMISLPVNVSEASIGAIFGSNVTTVYGWTGTSYELSNTLEPKRGYWALSSSNYDVTVTGTPVVDRDITLTRGWNMVGPVTNGVMVSSLPNVTTVYGWTGTSYTILDSTDTLTLTKGYWMLANAASTIQV